MGTIKKDEKSDTGFRPSFVVGCERSGTTLLAVLLSLPPETHYLSTLPRRRSCGLTHQAMLERAFTNRHIASLQLNQESTRRRFETMPASWDALFRAVLEEFSAAHGSAKPHVGEKTPLHLLGVPTLLRWYPQA